MTPCVVDVLDRHDHRERTAREADPAERTRSRAVGGTRAPAGSCCVPMMFEDSRSRPCSQSRPGKVRVVGPEDRTTECFRPGRRAVGSRRAVPSTTTSMPAANGSSSRSAIAMRTAARDRSCFVIASPRCTCTTRRPARRVTSAWGRRSGIGAAAPRRALRSRAGRATSIGAPRPARTRRPRRTVPVDRAGREVVVGIEHAACRPPRAARAARARSEHRLRRKVGCDVHP